MSDRVIDLDAARAARAEVAKENPVIKFAGENWALPPELPWAIAEAAGAATAEAAIAAVRSLLGDRWDAFLACGPTIDDMRILLENIAALYAVDPGK